jgi:hypothetical protein
MAAIAETTESVRLPNRNTHSRRGGPIARALPLVVVLTLAACATDADAQATSTTSLTSTGATTIIQEGTPTTAAPSTTTLPLDPMVTVSEALEASGANYRFTSVVLVGEDTLTSIGGVVDGNSVSAQIETGASELSYVRTADGEWVTGPEGEWVILEGEPPVSPPLGAMTDAGQLTLESGDAQRGVFTGVLGAAAGPAQGVPFSLTIDGGVVSEIRYEVDTGGETAQVITTFSDIGNAGTVTKPEGA